jgi:hypothetical protein
MRPSLLVLALACVLLVPVPALAQTSSVGPSGAQYDDQDPTGPGPAFPVGPLTGHNAMHAATMASGAIRATSEEAKAAGGRSVSATKSSNAPIERDAAFAEEGVAGSSAEAQGESAIASEAQGESAIASEAQGESAIASGLEKLPNTGGPPLPLGLFGAVMICVCGIIARRVLLA